MGHHPNLPARPAPRLPTPRPSVECLFVIRDLTRPADERAAAFASLLHSSGPWAGDQVSLIDFTMRCARALVRKQSSRPVFSQLEADVVATDALLDAWTHADRLPHTPAAFRGWLIGAIRIRLARESRKALPYTKTCSLEGTRLGNYVSRTMPWQSPSHHVGVSAEGPEVIQRAVSSAVNRLTPSLKTVAVLLLFEGDVSSSEIAARLQLRPGTVRQRWLRARRGLQDVLLKKLRTDASPELRRALARLEREATLT